VSFGISLTLRIERVAGDPAGAARLAAAMQPAVFNPVVGRSAVNLFREHYFALNTERPNKLGGKRTGFYADAARGTSATTLPDGVLLSVNQVGIRQRWLGGTIKAKPGGWLTIPARAEAHGKRAREFNDLRFQFFRSGTAALVRTDAIELKAKRNRKTGKVTYVAGKTVGGEVMYWLKRSVTQRPDPSVVPLPDVVYGRLNADGGAFLDRRIAGPARGASAASSGS
jgi:hypothetical protein